MVDSNVVNIAPDGDVILVVGEDRKRLRINSSALTFTSPVFNALFGPHFREGQQARSSTSPVEIALPEDNSAAMMRICEFLHFKSPHMPSDPSHWHVCLLALAEAVDKYALATALHTQLSALLFSWLHHNKNCSNLFMVADIVAAAYLLAQAQPFKIATEMLVLHCKDRFSKLHGKACSDKIPGMVFLAIDEKRRILLQEIWSSLAGMLPDYDYDPSETDCHALSYPNNLAAAFDTGSWPPPSSLGALPMSLDEALTQVERLPPLLIYTAKTDYCSHMEEEFAQQNFLDMAAMFRGWCGGLCLSCVRENAEISVNCNRRH